VSNETKSLEVGEKETIADKIGTPSSRGCSRQSWRFCRRSKMIGSTVETAWTQQMDKLLEKDCKVFYSTLLQ